MQQKYITPMKQQITYKELKQLFINFLKKNKITKQYRINTYNYLKKLRGIGEWKNYLFPLDNFIDRDDGRRLISGAFRWEDTPQGHTFWKTLDKKWCDFIGKPAIEDFAN